ncbi:FadR/GntR family transcriptional regulator [Shumkonia mesophila]|uniref:FadR/GntR family transcriptional regulator n=1 Tax=Shumkonia mesophila TaxID=2838854 RepID=UPI0029351298|nr:FCD domain-containing protein [Shumkonia mesophila]
MMFPPVNKRSSIGKHIVDSLHQTILSGGIKRGEKLPGQRELAQQFGASLTSVREAISVLAATGVISVTPGRGTIVCGIGDAEPSFDGWLGVASDDAEMNDFLEVRELLETHIVRKIARDSKAKDFGAITEALKRLQRKRKNPKAYLVEDLAFHRLLASYSGNKILEKLLLAIQTPMRSQISHSITRTMKKAGDLDTSWVLHRDVVDALVAGNADDAAKAIRAMVNRARLYHGAQEESAASGDTAVSEPGLKGRSRHPSRRASPRKGN